jgi:hypothetical protein
MSDAEKWGGHHLTALWFCGNWTAFNGDAGYAFNVVSN